MIQYPQSKTIPDTVYTGLWNDEIPVYTVFSTHGLNHLVGYVRHINAGNGTVLYRGQCNLYPSITPSIFHDSSSETVNKERLNQAVANIKNDESMLKFFHLDTTDVVGWDLYQKLTIEAALQHYGARTYCVDFVDNHWTALWFGLYRWNQSTKNYERRTSEKADKEDDLIRFTLDFGSPTSLPVEPDPIEVSNLSDRQMKSLKSIAKKSGKDLDILISGKLYSLNAQKRTIWLQRCEQIKEQNSQRENRINAFNVDSAKGHMFLFLYVADTNCPTMHGISFGEQTYTVDLRKVLPSVFLRPGSQHGWIVRGKKENYQFNSRVVCVARINIDLVDEMLGNGSLVRTDNFFPSYKFDQGYHVLLERQINSPIRSKTKNPKIIPENTIPSYF
ncbi:MAG: FRG domain-containing protein [Clostridia bacterium]|nr:FRG domain-containing protein [Clostridia bacterium]